MGTTADKLTYLNNTKSLLKDRLNSLGATITSSTTFRNYLTWLDTFYGEVSDKTDIATNGIVGRTSQETTTGKNHLNPVPSDTATGGITTSANSQTGYITMKGTSDRNYPWILKADANIPSGTTVVISSDSQYTMYARLYYDNTNYETINTSTTKYITLSHDIIKIAVLANMPTGTVVNETCYVQVEEGSTATAFEKFTYGPSPNPSYPQNIEVVTGENDIIIEGKNLFTGNYSQFTNTGGVGNLYDYFKIHDNDEYYTLTMIAKNDFVTSGSTYLGFTGNGGNVGSGVDWCIGGNLDTISKGTTLSMTSNKKYISMYSKGANTLKSFTDNFDIQLEKGSTATTYEPYVSQTYPVNLGNIELCKIDTYEDKIYSSDGRFYLYKEIGKVVLDGSEENWTYDGANTTPTPRTVMSNNLFEITNSNYYSNYFKQGSTTSYRLVLQPSNNNIYISLDNNLVGIVSEDTNAQKVTKMKNWLSTHNTIVYYPLATPTTTEITQDNYPSLYNALKQIQDYLTAYKINKEFVLGYSSPNIEY